MIDTPHFTEAETKAQRGEVTCSRSQGQESGEPRMWPSLTVLLWYLIFGVKSRHRAKGPRCILGGPALAKDPRQVDPFLWSLCFFVCKMGMNLFLIHWVVLRDER